MITPTMLYLLQFAILLAMPLAAEVGFRSARRDKARGKVASTSQISMVRSASFGILGLLTAFAMAMAEGRFSSRRALILDEANAIRTAWLRSQYLEEPHPAELQPLFRDYVDSRVTFYEDKHQLEVVERENAVAHGLQDAIWAHSVAVARDDPDHGDTISAYIDAVNDMIDLEKTRTLVLYAHVPRTIIGVVVLVGLLACGTTGYLSGVEDRRSTLAVTALPLLVGVAIGVILDLDSPRIGFITPGQRSMLELQEQLAQPPSPYSATSALVDSPRSSTASASP